VNGKQQKEAVAKGEPVLEGPEPVRMVPINPRMPGGQRTPKVLVEMLSGLIDNGVEFNVAVSSEFPLYEGRYVAMITWGSLIGKGLEEEE
jgi:hypothetical protein